MASSLDKYQQASNKPSALSMMFSQGFGTVVLVQGNNKQAPRFRQVSPLDDNGFVLQVYVPDEPTDIVARVHMGSFPFCAVKQHNGVWEYDILGRLLLEGDLSLLIAQLSAMVHEALDAKANHNPSDYAGIIPVGVQ